MSEKPDELPESAGGVMGESDVVAERSGAGTPRNRRPVPAGPPEEQETPDPARDEPEEDEDVTRPDIGPTG
ncbi:hypothetical protein MF672_024030 [Actinomadura sp. ATCC 31491]|uniref:Uncharacterized protein n=1 Tax=Actinomadura luzonensis TaxID=2805427 RepID=A0ABT0FX46_9ACTN|nr:hypothetical protein [Actinomadura luzonensis]MCK2216839.1 hypothetical protein [Actinomadura luzonensis]